MKKLLYLCILLLIGCSPQPTKGIVTIDENCHTTLNLDIHRELDIKIKANLGSGGKWNVYKYNKGYFDSLTENPEIVTEIGVDYVTFKFIPKMTGDTTITLYYSRSFDTIEKDGTVLPPYTPLKVRIFDIYINDKGGY